MVIIKLNMSKPIYCNLCPYVSYMYKDPEGGEVVRCCMITKRPTGTQALSAMCPMEEVCTNEK